MLSRITTLILKRGQKAGPFLAFLSNTPIGEQLLGQFGRFPAGNPDFQYVPKRISFSKIRVLKIRSTSQGFTEILCLSEITDEFEIPGKQPSFELEQDYGHPSEMSVQQFSKCAILEIARRTTEMVAEVRLK